MKKLKLLIPLSITLILLVTFFNQKETTIDNVKKDSISSIIKKDKKKKKTTEERRRFAEERIQYERKFQVNPTTGEIPKDEKSKEFIMSEGMMIKAKNKKSASTNSYISRGPSNLGGRTRSLVIDRSDPTGNTMIAGGVSSGVFRTTNGGASWTKVSANNEIHNVTTIAQDPRIGSENIWYYGTGERNGNSAGADGAFFFGQGIWQSVDGGLNWTQLPSTASVQERFDSIFDIIHKIIVHPITGEIYAATTQAILRFDGTDWNAEVASDTGGNFFTDVVITSTGIVYAGFAGNSGAAIEGVWQSPTGIGSYTRIGSNTTPGFGSSGRMVLAIAPSNENIVYAFHTVSGSPIEAGLWRWNNTGVGSWTDFSDKMPDEPDPDPTNPNTVADLPGNDPIAVQGGYDLVVSVKPNDENFVVIGGTNAYKIENINTDPTFLRIGGYVNNQSFNLYNLGGGDEHHPDIHSLVFDPQNPDIMFSGTDGGVHRTNNINAPIVAWTSLNNNYQTYQYYHIAADPSANSDFVIGGAQDNGTTAGGISVGLPDDTTMTSVAGGDGASVAISNENAPDLLFFASVQNGPIFRSGTGLITPDGIITPPDEPNNSQFVTYFYLDESNNNALYYAGKETMYATSDASTVTSLNWNNLGTIASASNGGSNDEWIVQYVASRGTYNPSSSYLLIGGDSGTVLRLDDPQNATTISSAIDITPNDASRTFPTVVSGLAVHPTNPNIAMLTYSNYGINSIYITENATDANPSWTLAERNLETFSIRSAAITEVDNETRYFVGTARGLYSSTDPINTDWEIEAPNQIGFAVVSALVYKPSNNKLLIGTHGNGMYEATIESSVLSVDEFDASASSFVAWPIPANNVLNIVVEDTFVEGDLDYEIFSITGKRLKSGVLTNNKQINVSNLSQGNYILQLGSASRKKAIVFNKR